MRSLYSKIILMSLVIILVSTMLSFWATNLFYHFTLKPKNDEKITAIAKNIASIYESGGGQELGDYLNDLTALGYQFHVIEPNGAESQYGARFRSTDLSEEEVGQVLSGEIYHGIASYPWKINVTGFFDNELKNTVGVPVQTDDGTVAMFVRPNTQLQFGEMRIFLGIMLILLLAISFLLILFSSRFIVHPIKTLAAATKKIAGGNYHLKLNTGRKDELGRLSRDFETMSEGLAHVEEKRQEFVSNVSHEIQSPLTSIKGFSQALREEGLPEELRRNYLEIIENESTRLSSLSQQLLTLSFLDHEVDKTNWSAFDVSEQLNETAAMTAWQRQEKEQTIELDLESVVINGDPKLLQLVWTNLISNAIRYTPNGGMITVTSRNTKKSAEIIVADTGIGIQEKDFAHLFERFYKADTARTRSEKSTGLGLSIVKKIIELHHGTIEVESTPEQGSRFICRIPK